MLTTPRLILTPLTLDDLDLYTVLFTDQNITRYLPGGKPFSQEYIAQYLPQRIAHWREHGFGTYAIALFDNPQTKIGYAGVEHANGTQYCDIRYGLLENYQGRGYAREASQAVIKATFANTQLDAIYGVAVKQNLGSISLLKRLGLTHTDINPYDADELDTFCLLRTAHKQD